MSFEVFQVNKLQRGHVRSCEHDRRRDACLEGFFPAGRAQAPTIAGLDTGKIVHRDGRAEIVAHQLRKF